MDNRKKLVGLVAAVAFAAVPAASVLAAAKVHCQLKDKSTKMLSAKRCAKKGGTVVESPKSAKAEAQSAPASAAAASPDAAQAQAQSQAPAQSQN